MEIYYWNCIDGLRFDLSIKECKGLIDYALEGQISDLYHCSLENFVLADWN